MSDAERLDGALGEAVARFEAAMSQLENTIERRLDAETSVNALHDDVQRMGEDRSQLASTLDQTEARAARLEEANREVSRRLVAAMESIRTVLETHGG